MLDRFIKSIIDHHVDTAVAFVSGAGFSLFGIWHINPKIIVGQLTYTFVFGAIGGAGGLFGKWICNKFFKKNRTRNGKN